MDYFLQIFNLIGIFIILATSLNLINGYTGMFSLGHAGFWAVGAYTSAAFTVFVLPDSQAWWKFPVALVLGAVAAGICGIVVGVPCLRLRGDYLAIATLGFGEIIRIILIHLDFLGGSKGFTKIMPGQVGTLWIWTVTILSLLFLRNIVQSAFGRAFIAIREDELAAEAMGISTTRYKVASFVVSAALAGVAGTLYAHYQAFIVPKEFGFLRGIEILLMVVFGGLGSMLGAVAAAIMLTVFQELTRSFAEWRMVVYAVMLIVMMLVRPQGLFGTLEFDDVFDRYVRGRFSRKEKDHV